MTGVCRQCGFEKAIAICHGGREVTTSCSACGYHFYVPSPDLFQPSIEPGVRPGERVEFGGVRSGRQYLRYGWERPESWGVPLAGGWATIDLPLGSAVSSRFGVDLVFRLLDDVKCGAVLYGQDRFLGGRVMAGYGDHVVKLTLPLSPAACGWRVRLEVELDPSTASDGCGLGIVSVMALNLPPMGP